MKRQDFINCIKTYLDKGYDIKHKDTSTPKISVYYMLGYLSRALGSKVSKELENYLNEVIEKRYK